MIRFGIRLPVPGPFYAFIPLNRRRGRRLTRQMVAAHNERETERAQARYDRAVAPRIKQIDLDICMAQAKIDRMGAQHMASAHLVRYVANLRAERARIVR